MGDYAVDGLCGGDEDASGGADAGDRENAAGGGDAPAGAVAEAAGCVFNFQAQDAGGGEDAANGGRTSGGCRGGCRGHVRFCG